MKIFAFIYILWLYIKSFKKFANLLLLCKAQGKNDITKDVEMIRIIPSSCTTVRQRITKFSSESTNPMLRSES